MQSLKDLAARLAADDEWEEERPVVDAVCAELEAQRPPYLKEASGESRDRYVILEFRHDDGTVLEITHGDGYTSVLGGGVSYHGYLKTSDLVDLLTGALRGRMTYVRHSRFGLKVADYFEVVGRKGQRLGYAQGLASAGPLLLRSIPGLPESVGRTRVSFKTTPAATVA